MVGLFFYPSPQNQWIYPGLRNFPPSFVFLRDYRICGALGCIYRVIDESTVGMGRYARLGIRVMIRGRVDFGSNEWHVEMI
jgi:hypothetical protein